ncbi:MAG TPA: 23S rRNA (uracil(1939)-C(5))-methyltransferase RlmD [Spirochaetota bacterium]|nr:23S rRNA (uracil(1939)-C(5))-methyltransferase RlmD [Spirochaetota bacterium]
MKKKKRKIFEELADKYRGGGAEPRCPHFGTCGGCMFQSVPYEGQLMIKRDYLNSLFDGMLSLEGVSSSDAFGYRNRMDMVTAFGKMGLREAGSYKFVVDVESCPIMQEKSCGLMQKARPPVRQIEDYDYLRHRGYLRYLVFRQARFTGECMVNFVVARDEDLLDTVIEAVAPETDSISVILSDGLADLSFGPVIRTVKKGFIIEEFDGISYRVTPNSFFQSNSPVARQMYRRIKDCVKGRVLDLYSGVGSISLYVAGECESVTGVEEVPEAVDTAMLNRDENRIANADFVCSDVKEFMKNTEDTFDTLILDPPRSGMNPKVVKYINAMRPGRIIYMSCNPAAFRQEMELLEGYGVEFFEAYDMFPQTPHVETLALLTRK